MDALIDDVVAAASRVADAVAGVASWSSVDLHRVTLALHRASSQMSAATAIVTASWDDRRAWAIEGHRSAVSCLTSSGGLSPRSARRALRRARALRAMPVAAHAVREGRLPLDHVDLLSRADQPWRHEVFAAHESTLVDQVSRLGWGDAQRVVEYWIQRVDAEASAEGARLRGLEVHCWVSPTLDGRVVVDAVLDPIGGEIVANELRRLERGQWLADQQAGSTRTAGQRRAAALVEMARRSASFGAGGRPARPLFTVHVGDESAKHLCQLASGTVLHPSELVPHLDAALIETVLFDGPHTVLGVSDRRTFTGALRRAIVARDRFCTHPSGCDVPAEQCDIDHVVPWALGGTTCLQNGRALCSTHNRDAGLRGPAPPTAAA